MAKLKSRRVRIVKSVQSLSPMAERPASKAKGPAAKEIRAANSRRLRTVRKAEGGKAALRKIVGRQRKIQAQGRLF